MSDPLGPCNMFEARLLVDGRIVGRVLDDSVMMDVRLIVAV